MAISGHTHFEIKDNSIIALKMLLDDKSAGERVFISKKYEDVIADIFDKVTPEVKAYIGENCYLDGMMWLVTRAEHTKSRGSSNWHTDNVGNRLRLFICVEGDGSQPTMIVPSKVRIPSFFTWAKYTFLEMLRWIGFEVKLSMQNQYACRHKTGSAYMFDSQLFHRGGYETGNAERVILSLEFSNPEKHELARGPIGTEQHLQFSFDKELLNCESFKQVLDADRMSLRENIIFYGLSQ